MIAIYSSRAFISDTYLQYLIQEHGSPDTEITMSKGKVKGLTGDHDFAFVIHGPHALRGMRPPSGEKGELHIVDPKHNDHEKEIMDLGVVMGWEVKIINQDEWDLK